MKFNIFFYGEILSKWRDEIIEKFKHASLPVDLDYPEQSHDQSGLRDPLA